MDIKAKHNMDFVTRYEGPTDTLRCYGKHSTQYLYHVNLRNMQEAMWKGLELRLQKIGKQDTMLYSISINDGVVTERKSNIRPTGAEGKVKVNTFENEAEYVYIRILDHLIDGYEPVNLKWIGR